MHASSPGGSRSRLGVRVLAALGLLSGCGSPKSPPPRSATTGSGSVATAPTAVAIALPAPVPTTASSRATLKLDSTWVHCHEPFVPQTANAAATPAAEAGRLAELCAAATRMHRVVPPFLGDQAAAGKPQAFHWKAQAGHCYRAYGVGGPGIKNLDLLMLDSAGAVLGQDGNDDDAPVLLPAGAVCFKLDDDATLVVSVGNGAGPFAVEMWGD